MTTKTLCILANSVKRGESCIAGLEIAQRPDKFWQNTGRWIRPVSHRDGGAISGSESYLHPPGKTPELFDIVTVPLQQPASVQGQPEDWWIEPSATWQYQGKFDPQESVRDFLEDPKDLWCQPNQPQDRVTPDWWAGQRLPSLYLIEPERMELYVHLQDYGSGPQRRSRARFRYRGVDHDWSMTDPVASRNHLPDFSSRGIGPDHGVALPCLAVCVSLAPAWKADHASRPYHFKLVAGVIEKP